MKVLSAGNGQLHNMSMLEVANTLDTMHDQQMILIDFEGGETVGGRRYILRRLTPLECCRLQGFPDWWTSDVPGSDSATYKMWGNGVTLPVVDSVIGKIANEIRRTRRDSEKEDNRNDT